MDDLIIINATIATPVGKEAKYGKEMKDIKIINKGAIIIKNGNIVDVGKTDYILDKYNTRSSNIIDAKSKCVIPGFVDSHTHFIFGGYREKEFMSRINGISYMEIMKNHGGIENTVSKTRESSFTELYKLGYQRLNNMLSFGITTVEGKSGYGLDFDTEIKQLKVMKELNENHPIDIVETYLGAHSIPKEYEGKDADYINYIIKYVIPYIAKYKLAEFCDVFCEKDVISINLSEKLLINARKNSLKLKIHADEITSSGGAELAGSLNAVSADHLLNASDDGIRSLSKNKVIATLLPLTAFCLNKPYANARKMIDEGCAVALASDFNPGSCFTNSIPLIIAISCIYMNMSVEEVLTALTLNGAAAVDREKLVGSIEKGKQGDLVILKYPNYNFLPYCTGINIVDTVIKKGAVVYKNK
ncbi:imidazolonepropionase [Thermoanaerobacterium sp. RBIITD]|uniref:imidazolonepropionase n=1 Tax=Thermoanaerobacterium sp. RBIITD TaxID=1550240 RepID=UPI000BB7E767|nr:imidazolonepropionase [Thermoanaerobacterium sp. RBIITD]SNX54283.1 imidazolonepropionase [Thermoanaerobacterium sp. RBIITD]